MSAEDRSGSGNGRRDARHPRFTLDSDEEIECAEAAAWFATLAWTTCPACKAIAWKNARATLARLIAKIDEGLARSEALHGKAPAHAAQIADNVTH